MNKNKKIAGVITLLLITATLSTKAQNTNVFTVKANTIKATIQPTMWGVFFEDINMG
ncbi:MAG: hypothetical protein H7101_00365, partial [Deinococcales bacterium]|nr:hypothetical protein [Chitinophagaceae bacterium]